MENKYQNEVNKKKSNTTKKKSSNNTVVNTSNKKKKSSNNNINTSNTKKKTSTTKKKTNNTQTKSSNNKNTKVKTTVKKETYIPNKKEIIKKENTLLKKEELKDLFLNNTIKILNKKDLNKIIKSYEKDIKKETPKKKKKKRRIRWNNVILFIFVVVFLTILIISTTKIINWIKDSSNSDEVITEIQNSTEIIETETNEQTELIETPVEEEKEIPKTSPYWTYIEMNLIDVDFTELKQKNSDVSGWIQVNGTNINYPYVQTSDNEYYLTHSFDKTTNSAGWVFMDYRNNKSDFDKNTIIYAHSRKNNTMFGTLRKILKNGWLNNTNNHVIKLSTESENTLWQVFSVYRIPTTNDYIQVSFVNDTEFVNFENMLLERSAYNFNTSVSSEDKILTLSTCYDDYDKVVLHAKLIKREKK